MHRMMHILRLRASLVDIFLDFPAQFAFGLSVEETSRPPLAKTEEGNRSVL